MAVPQQLVELEDCQENWEYAQSRLFDTGDIKTSIKNADHAGWLLCNARSMTGGGSLRTLLLQLGSPFGVSGADPLLPEGREKVFVGAGATHALGATFGTATPSMPAHTTNSENANHTHAMGANVWNDATGVAGIVVGGSYALGNPSTGTQSSNHQHTVTGVGSATDGNYPPSVAVNYFIHI